MPKTVEQLALELDDEEVLAAYAYLQFNSAVDNDCWLRVILSCGNEEDRTSIEAYLAKLWPSIRLPSTDDMREFVKQQWTKYPPKVRETPRFVQAQLYVELIKEAQQGIKIERNLKPNPNLERTTQQYTDAIDRYLWWLRVNGYEVADRAHT